MHQRTSGSRRRTTITAVAFAAFAIALTAAVWLSLGYMPKVQPDETATALPTFTTPAQVVEESARVADSEPAVEPGSGQRAVAVFARVFESADWTPGAGDTVDLVAVFRRGSPEVELDEDAVALVRDVKVIGYVNLGDTGPVVAVANDAVIRTTLATITLELSPRESQLVALARQMGEIRVGKCPDADCSGALTTP